MSLHSSWIINYAVVVSGAKSNSSSQPVQQQQAGGEWDGEVMLLSCCWIYTGITLLLVFFNFLRIFLPVPFRTTTNLSYTYLNLNVPTIAGSNTAFAPPQTSSSFSSQARIANVAQQQQPSQELLDLISRQVSVELSASQAYMSASIWFRAREMDGSAAWTLEESDEERGHGKEILEFAMKNHFPVTLEPLAAPKNDWNHPSEVWETILGLEQQNTQNLLRIAAVADQCGMYGVKAFLDPFHVEQIDAEDKVGGILAKVRGADEALLWQIDHMLGIEAEEEDHH